MATGCDKAIGLSMVLFSCAVFIYYTFWVIILPFVDDDHNLHKYFPSPLYAIALPIVIGVVCVFALGAFIGFVVVRSKLKEKES